MKTVSLIALLVLLVATHIAGYAAIGAEPLPIRDWQAPPTVIVAHGRLMDAGIYRHPTDNRPDEFLMGWAQYEVDEVVRGTLPDPVVRVTFNAGTQLLPLPTQAILLLTADSLPGRYSPLGEEASRGILPDTLENRSRIGKLSDEELAQSPSEHQLPPQEAVQLAHLALKRYSDYTGYGGQSRLVNMHRKPFGWFLSLAVLDQRPPHPSVIPLAAHVSDDGRVVNLSKLLFAGPWSPDEWHSMAGVLLEQRLETKYEVLQAEP